MSVSDWKPIMRAASALSMDRFAMCWGELEYDDPFTAIISYDGRSAQPWSRVDVRREIVDVGYGNFDGKADPIPVALSNEGDVYTLVDDRAEWSKIPGAGVLSNDSKGLGAVHTLLLDGSTQYVLGDGRQLYQRQIPGAWHCVSADAAKPPGYGRENFGKAIRLPSGDLLIESIQRPYSSRDPAQFDPSFWAKMSVEEVTQMMLSQQKKLAGGQPVQRLYTYVRGQFNKIELPEDIRIQDMYIDPQHRVWLLGFGGLILRGNPQSGFERLGFHGDTEALFSAAWFHDELILATDDGLRRFDGHKLKSLKPVLDNAFVNRNVPVPLRVQAIGDRIIYFDAKHGVAHWDGDSWTWIQIPKELLKRDFQGLIPLP
ncbi:hypothetical protein FBZ99_11542 [Rhizobium sp. ERR 1071]|nr:hypothetical protein FBZ99_11542 [Rhizobium sp. ERR1071]